TYQLPAPRRCLGRPVRRIRDLGRRSRRLAPPLADLAHDVGPGQVSLRLSLVDGVLEVGVGNSIGYRIGIGALVTVPEERAGGTQMIATPITRVSAVNAERAAAAAIPPPGDLTILLTAADCHPDAALSATDDLCCSELGVLAELFLRRVHT